MFSLPIDNNEQVTAALLCTIVIALHYGIATSPLFRG